MNYKIIIGVLGGALAMFAVLLVVGLATQTPYNESFNNNPGITNSEPKVSTDTLSEAEKRAFIDACVGGEVTREDCRCYIDYLDFTYGKSYTLGVASEYDRTGIIPDEVFEAVYACTPYYPTTLR